MRRLANLLALAAIAGCSQPRLTPATAERPPAIRPAVPAAPAQPTRVAFTLDGPLMQGAVVRGRAPSGTSVLLFNDRPVPVDHEGRFLIAFDRDAGPAARLTAKLSDGRTVNHPLAVAPRDWRIERLDSLPRLTRPSAEFARLRPAEVAQINAARAIATDSEGWRQSFLWPAVGRISGLFGAQRIYKGEPGSYHSGTDVAKPQGATVLAPADGVVILATDHPFTLEGNLLMLDHGMGLNSAFLHLSRIDVRVGERVRRGQPIAAVGMSGRATGPHLHWGLRWRDARVDPLLLAGPMPSAQ